MADLYAVNGDTLTDIAEAIRLKRDITDGIPVSDMAMQIGLIGGGGSEIKIGTYTPSVDNAKLTLDVGIDARAIIIFADNISNQYMTPSRSIAVHYYDIAHRFRASLHRSNTDGNPNSFNGARYSFDSASYPTTFENGILTVSSIQSVSGLFKAGYTYTWIAIK